MKYKKQYETGVLPGPTETRKDRRGCKHNHRGCLCNTNKGGTTAILDKKKSTLSRGRCTDAIVGGENNKINYSKSVLSHGNTPGVTARVVIGAIVGDSNHATVDRINSITKFDSKLSE